MTKFVPRKGMVPLYLHFTVMARLWAIAHDQQCPPWQLVERWIAGAEAQSLAPPATPPPPTP